MRARVSVVERSLAGVAAAAVLVACAGEGATQERLTREDSEAHLFALCQDERDNDADGLTDCADPDCASFLVCGGAPDADADADATGGSDGADVAGDGTAAETTSPPTPCFTDAECDAAHGVLCVLSACQVPHDYTVPPDPGSYDAMGMVRGLGATGESAAIGAPIATFCGVTARAHGPVPDAFDARTYYGFGYQSTELAYRYLCGFATDVAAHIHASEGQTFPFRCAYDQVTGAVSPRHRADQWYDATGDATLGLLERHPNGGTEPPRAGDLLVFDISPAGHLAIVTRVLANDRHGLLEVVEQGLWEASHRYRLAVSPEGRYTVPGARGWLRVPGLPPACGVAGELGLVQIVRDAERDLLLVEASVTATGPLFIGWIALVDEDGVSRLSRSHLGAPSVAFSASIDLAAAEIGPGEHALSLEVVPGGLAHPFAERLATARYRYEADSAPHSYAALLAAAAADYAVPACVLAAIAEAWSGWWQGARGPTGAVGVMQLAPAELATAAALSGEPDPDRLTDPGEDGAAANIRAGAALLASWAYGAPGVAGRLAPGDPPAAVESWWPAVARFGGAGVDGDLATSNFVYRVYDLLTRGVPGRVPKVAGLDVAALGADVTSRPATPEELAAGDVLPTDADLIPATPALYLRRFDPVAATSLPALHRCAGACTTSDCGAVACAPEADVACVAGQLVGRDACGGAGAVVDPCAADDDPCTLDSCASARCVTVTAPDGTPCDDTLKVCSAGACIDAADADGDGYYRDDEPFDCPGHDDDRYIHPGHPEVFDVRDNDCDGGHDDDGFLRLYRYRKQWTTTDWEHRYSATPITTSAGWVKEDRWIGIYPPDVCTSAQAPLDGCEMKKNDTEVDLTGAGFILVGLVQCSGVYGSGKHITLLLQEDSGEYGDYHQAPHFTCKRLGYIPGTTARAVMPSLKYLYRHRAGFDSYGVSDNMWSTIPDEGEPQYPLHQQSFPVLAGE